MKIFWSWQSDLTGKVTRNVVQDALGRALLALGDELELAPSDRPELDHDTKNSPGMASGWECRPKSCIGFIPAPSASRTSGRNMAGPCRCFTENVEVVTLRVKISNSCHEMWLNFVVGPGDLMSKNIPAGPVPV